MQLKLLIFLLLAGCGSIGPQGGLLYHNVKYGVNATEVTEVTKNGRACSSSFLGLFASGDASIERAKKNGGITKVSSVDAKSNSVFFFYNRFCTIVTGE